MEGRELDYVILGGNHWQVTVNMVMYLGATYKAGNC